MKDILGLLFLICVTIVGIYLGTTKQIEWRMFSALLVFGLAAGFVISRYDTIRIFQYKDVKLETFQGQVDAITARALKDVQEEVKAQKESLRLVIADANVTREKLNEQKTSLETLYDKTKKLETNIDTQNQKLESTIAKSAQIESSMLQAQRVLAQLEKETTNADQKLKLLDEKTSGISRLPDGRLKIGSMIAGEPTLIDAEAKKMTTAFAAHDYRKTYNLAKAFVMMHEETERATKDAGIMAGDLNPAWLSQVYQIASDSARLTNSSADAVAWAKKALKYADGGVTRAALVLSLRAANNAPEADKLISETLTMDAKTAQEFRDVMKRVGAAIP